MLVGPCRVRPVLRRVVVSFVLPLFCALLSSLRILAAPGEVTNLNVLSSQTISWDSLTGTEGYHVYKGTAAGLQAGNYGTCLLGSLQGTQASDTQNPPLGTAFIYLVAGFDPSGQGSLGT